MAANAGAITFEGTTSAQDATLGIAVGDGFSATVDFDLSGVTSASGVNFTAYSVAGSAVVRVGGYTAAATITDINVANDYSINLFDAWAAIGNIGGLPFLLILNDPDAVALDSTALFLPSSTSGYAVTFWRVGAANGTIDRISVPEPGTLALLGAAVLGFGFLRRKKPV